MALNFYSPPFESNSSGEVKGSAAGPGLEEHIEWYGFIWECESPMDAKTGLPTGKAQHGALTAIKLLDKASPLLFDTLTKNGTILSIEFKFYRPDDSGGETHYYTITLEEAKISNIRQEQLNNRYPEHLDHETREHISFVYDKITMEEVEAGIMAFDSWRQTQRGG